MKKFFVTGGLGFIGSNLIKYLLELGYQVINLDKITYASNFYNIKEFKNKTKVVKITSAGLNESHVHSISITRESPNYQLNK